MATPDFVLALRAKIGHEMLWLSGVTAVVIRGDEVLLVRRADTGARTPVTGIVDPGEHTDATWYPLDALPPMSDNMRERIHSAVDFDGTTRFES